MIHELRVQSKKYACPEWWAKVPQLAKRKKWSFEPGLNILWGPNGSGKSTMLLAMAHMFHCCPSQVQFWKVLPKLASRIQIIVATHSILAVNIEGANYIELEKGYLEKCREVLG